MLTEMHGKGGKLCSHAREGKIRCPLIVRPTSEDVITGHLIQSLRYLNPRWWLPDLLNLALGERRFPRQLYRRLKLEVWKNRPCYPRELLPWSEGSTQVDVTVTWENPPTTVYLEMKYGSDLSTNVSADDGRNGYPSDQLVRNIRVGLLQCGYFDQGRRLFTLPPRDFALLVIAPTTGHSLVERYRSPDQVRKAIPHSDRLVNMPRPPFVGELSYGDICGVLGRQSRWFTRSEIMVAEDLTNYLEYKLTTAPGRVPHRQAIEAPDGYGPPWQKPISHATCNRTPVTSA